MPKFKVTVTERVVSQAIIEADSPESVDHILGQAYDNVGWTTVSELQIGDHEIEPVTIVPISKYACPTCGREASDPEMVWPAYTVYRPEHDPSGLGEWRVCWQGEDNIPLSVDPNDAPLWRDVLGQPDPKRRFAMAMVWAIAAVPTPLKK